MDTATLLQTISVYALPLLFAFTVHEAGHAYAAHHLGDNTPMSMGRVTLNPTKHIDPIFTILLPLVLMLLHSPLLIGGAKPVLVREGQLRNPKRDAILVALAGSAANLAMALAWGVLLYLLQGVGVTELYFLKVCQAGVQVNVMLVAFNMFPLPPLDGGRVLTGLLPHQQAEAVSRIAPYGFYILLALVLLGVLNSFWMQPVMALIYGFLNLLLSPLSVLL